MFDFFRSKPLLSEQDFAFQVETYRWLLKHFGGRDFYHETSLILPTRDFFPAEVSTERAIAYETFQSVKKHAGMEKWPCQLQAQNQDSNPLVSPTVTIQNTPQNPLGTFSADEEQEIIITYNPALVSHPIRLVATLAHELSHYLTAHCAEEPPGGWENWEFATDLTATFLGFGLFMANSAVFFQQYRNVDAQGWQYSHNGYLSEAEHIMALAIFLRLKQIPECEALPHLKPHLKKILKKALRDLGLTEAITELKSIKYVHLQ